MTKKTRKLLLSVLFGIFMLLSVVCIAIIFTVGSIDEVCETTLAEGKFPIVGERVHLDFVPENDGECAVMLEFYAEEDTDFDDFLYGVSTVFLARTKVYRDKKVVSVRNFSNRMPPAMSYHDEGVYRVQLATLYAEAGGRYSVVFTLEGPNDRLSGLDGMSKKIWVEEARPACQISAANTLANIATFVLLFSLVATVILGLKLRKALV